MILQYSIKTKEINQIEDRLKQLTLAYGVDLNDTHLEPAFIDGSKEYRGIDKMNTYLDQLENEKEQWYYCDC